MRVQMLCPVTIVRGAEDGGDANYERDAEYEVNDTLGEFMVASGQAVALEEPNLIGFVNPLPEPTPSRRTKRASGPPENK